MYELKKIKTSPHFRSVRSFNAFGKIIDPVMILRTLKHLVYWTHIPSWPNGVLQDCTSKMIKARTIIKIEREI